MKRSILALAVSALALIQSPAAGFDFKIPKIPGLPEGVQDALLPAGGAILGGAGCAAFYKGRHQAMVTSLCAAGGAGAAAWVGGALRDHLREREKAQLAEATYKTLESGSQQTMRTQEGTQITTEIVKPVAAAPVAQPTNPKLRPSRRDAAQAAPQTAAQDASPPPAATTVAAAADPNCNEVRQTIVTADNQRFEENIKACKQGDIWIVA